METNVMESNVADVGTMKPEVSESEIIESKLVGKKLKKQKENSPVKRSTGQKVALWIVCAIFILYSVSLLFPFAWLLFNSFKTRQDFLTSAVANGGMSIPEIFDPHNYYEALIGFKLTVGSGSAVKEVNLLQMFLNSIILTATTTFLEVFFSACTAYVLAKYNFPGKKIIFGMVLASMVIPVVGTLPVMYDFIGSIGLMDTLPGVWIVYVGGFAFGFLLLNGHFKSLSWTYAEAAQIDGATSFGVFFKIMIPLSMPALISLAIITAIDYWNNFGTPKIYLPSMPTVAVRLDSLMIEIEKTSDYPLMFACVLVAIAPIVAIFCCFHKVIISNMVAGGIKG